MFIFRMFLYLFFHNCNATIKYNYDLPPWYFIKTIKTLFKSTFIVINHLPYSKIINVYITFIDFFLYVFFYLNHQ